MALIRFTSPIPDLVLSGVPAVFENYVCDIPDSETGRLARMRYLGAPYGVNEEGAITDTTPWPTTAEIAADINDPSSAIGQAIAQLVGGNDPTVLTAQVGQLRQDVDNLLSQPGGGGGVVVGAELPATANPGVLAARLRTY